jgi:formiminoglutamase/agmatinase
MMPGTTESRDRRHLLEAASPTHRFALLGIPWDMPTALSYPGGRYGPQALREALTKILGARVEEGRIADVYEGIVDLSGVEFLDAGDVSLSYDSADVAQEQIYSCARDLMNQGYTIIAVGGDHAVMFPVLRALHDQTPQEIALIQLDAHYDWAESNFRQGSYSNSSGMRRAVELDRLSGEHVVQIGLRGYTTPSQFDAANQAGVRRVLARDVADRGAAEVAREALEISGGRRRELYLTVDVDVVDPGSAPGSGWPEPAGLRSQDVIDIVRLLAPHVAAFDISELNPLFDHRSTATVALAATLVLDFITAKARAN